MLPNQFSCSSLFSLCNCSEVGAKKFWRLVIGWLLFEIKPINQWLRCSRPRDSQMSFVLFGIKTARSCHLSVLRMNQTEDRACDETCSWCNTVVDN